MRGFGCLLYSIGRLNIQHVLRMRSDDYIFTGVIGRIAVEMPHLNTVIEHLVAVFLISDQTMR